MDKSTSLGLPKSTKAQYFKLFCLLFLVVFHFVLFCFVFCSSRICLYWHSDPSSYEISLVIGDPLTFFLVQEIRK